MRNVSAETVGSSGVFRRSGMVFRCGSLRDMSECPFNVLFCGTFGGGGNGGGNFPRRKPLSVLSVAAPRPVSPSPKSTRSVALELDFTSERYSRSSPERANELRGDGDDKRGRENRLRKRDTADPGGGSFISSSCVTGSAGEMLGSKKMIRKLHVPEMMRAQGSVGGASEVESLLWEISSRSPHWSA